MSRRVVLVVGGSGFIGSALARHLREGYDDVVVFARRNPAVPGARHWRCSAYSQAEFAACLEAIGPDVVFHAAGSTLGATPALIDANVRPGEALLAAVHHMRADVPVVLLGSAAECGPINRPGGQVDEEMACCPETDYGRTKLQQTRLGLGYARKGVRVIVARLFNVVGAGMPASLALGRFAGQIAALGPAGGVLQTGNLDAERDFASLTSVVEILDALSRESRAVGEIVNVCTGRVVSMSDIVHRLVAASRLDIRIEIDPSRRGVSSVARMIGSTAKLESYGLSVPTLDLDRDLRLLLDHARTNRRSCR